MNAIRRMPATAEFFFVILFSFGYFIYLSSWWVGNPPAQPVAYIFDNQESLTLLAQELIILWLVARFLQLRGWHREQFSIRLTWSALFGGLLLLGIHYGVYVFGYSSLSSASGGPEIFERIRFSSEVTLPVAVLFSIINPVFEELLVVGYVIQALEKKHGPAFAIGASTLIRLLYHTYQGPFAIVSILPLGILFAVAYHRRRDLSPLVIAHGMADFMALTEGS